MFVGFERINLNLVIKSHIFLLLLFLVWKYNYYTFCASCSANVNRYEESYYESKCRFL